MTFSRIPQLKLNRYLRLKLSLSFKTRSHEIQISFSSGFKGSLHLYFTRCQESVPVIDDDLEVTTFMIDGHMIRVVIVNDSIRLNARDSSCVEKSFVL